MSSNDPQMLGSCGIVVYDMTGTVIEVDSSNESHVIAVGDNTATGVLRGETDFLCVYERGFGGCQAVVVRPSSSLLSDVRRVLSHCLGAAVIGASNASPFIPTAEPVAVHISERQEGAWWARVLREVKRPRLRAPAGAVATSIRARPPKLRTSQVPLNDVGDWRFGGS